jgi:hypothetical protein
MAMSSVGWEAKPRKIVDPTYSALRQLIIHRPGGWADQEALRAARELCAEARKAAAATPRIALIEGMLADLYSDTGHRKWDLTTTSGRDFLRLAILRELNER